MNPRRRLSGCPPEDCQKQYFLRAVFTDYPQVLAGWQQASQTVRAELRCELDLPYGAGMLQKLDLFAAAGANAPLLVFLHGGYWQGGDKSDVSFVARGFVERGISVAVANYSLAPQASIAGMLAETRALFEWLHGHAAAYGFDPQRIFAVGHSAGGQLAAMMLTEDWAPLADGQPIVRQAFAISGLFDLRPLRHTVLNEALKLDEAEAARVSPVDHEQRYGTLHPIVGALETQEFHLQMELIRDSWPAVAQPLTVPQVHHYTVLNHFADPGTELFAYVLKALDCR